MVYNMYSVDGVRIMHMGVCIMHMGFYLFFNFFLERLFHVT